MEAGGIRRDSAAVELRSLLHDLRQYVGAGLLLFDDVDQLGEEDLRKRVQTGRTLLEQLSAVVEGADEHAGSGELVVVSKLVGEAVAIFRHAHPTIEVRASYRSDALCRLDSARMHRALTNVLENAARAAGDLGQVVVEVRRDDDHVLVEVTDNGRGFGLISRGTGHGMLAISDLVRSANGQLTIHSGPGVGTQVRLVLPCVGEAR
jgi:signal transduction histidine kinase